MLFIEKSLIAFNHSNWICRWVRVRLRDSAIGQSLTAAVGPDRTANKDQPYQYSQSSAHPLDDSGRAAAGAVQSRAGLTTLVIFSLEETICQHADFDWLFSRLLPSFLPLIQDGLIINANLMRSLDAFRLINFIRPIDFVSYNRCSTVDPTGHTESFSNEQGHELDLLTS